MDSSSSWPESLPSNRIKAIEELTKGQVLTNKLREMLDQPEKIESDIKSVNGVIEQILGMFDNTLSILNPANLKESPHNPTNHVGTPRMLDGQKSEDSDQSIIKTITPVKTKRGCYKRRKNVSTITKFTYTLSDDGYAWRKYGQKAILNSKHQRNYFRCSHKFEQGCQATKQVQKTDDEPSKYMITYNGVHTCNNSQRAQIIEEASNPMDDLNLLSFETNTIVKNNKADHYTPWGQIGGLSNVPLEPMSMMSSELEYEDMVSSGVFSSRCSTIGYEEDMTKGCDLGFLFDMFS